MSRVLRLIDEQGIIQRRAGVVFKNLRVSGKGSAINLQSNVGSALMAPFRLRESFTKGSEKIILNSFDGVVKSGEMLVVLGRPGSGCSTLLKTLTGELRGLDLKNDSAIHYNGL
jgi:ATP-binding cassette, subfamily G (WHITE), member 2, PDR